MNRIVKRQIATTQDGIAMEMLTKSIQLVFSEVHKHDTPKVTKL